MEHVPNNDLLNNESVKRVSAALDSHGMKSPIHALSDSARTAAEAASALGVEVGQIASSIVFKLPNGNALLVVTSGRHRVDTEMVARNLKIEKLHRADADFVRNVSGFAIGGVSPLGWISKPQLILIDEALNNYETVWAAAGHPHSVFATTFHELVTCTGGTPMVVGP